MTHPHFDDSVAQAAASLHLAPLFLAAVTAAFALYAVVERRARGSWARVPLLTGTNPGGPYRSHRVIGARMTGAPRLVRATAFSGFAFGHLFGPGLVLALTSFPADGISVPLVPGLAVVLAYWWCSWLILRRSAIAAQALRYTALSSLVMNVGLLSLAAGHLGLVEYQRLEGIEHACSSSVTAVVFVFAGASIAHAILLLATLRAHQRALDDGGDSIVQSSEAGDAPSAAVNARS